MPRISKVKFCSDGKSKRYTDTGFTYEYNLYYDGRYDFFYFKEEEYREVAPELKESHFKDCRTKSDAVLVMENGLKLGQEESRKLIIQIELCYWDLDREEALVDFKNLKGVNSTTGYDYKMTTAALKVSYKRLIRIKSPNGKGYYVNSNNNWDRGHEKVTPAANRFVIIDWTTDREAYLRRICETLNNVSKELVEFLSFKNNESFGEALDNAMNLKLIN